MSWSFSNRRSSPWLSQSLQQGSPERESRQQAEHMDVFMQGMRAVAWYAQAIQRGDA